MSRPRDPYLVFLPSALPPRSCSAASPMPRADMDRYHWSHADAVAVAPLYNLMIYKCPHCGMTFHAPKART